MNNLSEAPGWTSGWMANVARGPGAQLVQIPARQYHPKLTGEERVSYLHNLTITILEVEEMIDLLTTGLIHLVKRRIILSHNIPDLIRVLSKTHAKVACPKVDVAEEVNIKRERVPM